MEQQVSQLLTERDQLKHQLNELRTGNALCTSWSIVILILVGEN